VFRRRQFLHGTPAPESTRDDVDWYRPDGVSMSPQDWNASFARAVTMALSGATGDPTRPDDPFLWMINAWWEPLDFSIPNSLRDLSWQVELDTGNPDARRRAVDATEPITLTGRSLILLRATKR
jgi:glycogen operon protein